MDKVNIMQEKWDYLIILDACRYDYFERIYESYLQGKLTKKISIGSCTDEWRDNTFTGRYDDVVYISANPHISSSVKVTGFLGSEHFHKVYDIWKKGWDKERGTVLPGTMTKTAIDIIARTKDKRVIIHYLQPHAPYLCLDNAFQGFADPNFSMAKFLQGIELQDQKAKIRNRIQKILLKICKKHNAITEKLLGDHPEWMLRQFLCLPPKTPMDVVRRKSSKIGLRKAYEANLRIVLEQVAVLLKHLSGKIVLTSDHGELLGENKCYTHRAGSIKPQLIEIPYVVIQKPTDTKITMPEMENTQTVKFETELPASQEVSMNDEEKLLERLRDLGYYD